MNILSAEKIKKSYSEKMLFENLSIGISEGEKICLIGINGTGKSTLLKVIAGVEYPDAGSVVSGNNIKIEYLPQNPAFSESISVLEYVFKGNSAIMNLIRAYESALIKIEESPFDEVLSKNLMELSHKMDSMDGWSVEKEAKSILTQLGVTDFDALVDHLSGGQKKRVAMAGALISPADLLILDEPTNHIDNDTVDWLERYLNKRSGALLMVTHDRYFLERVANRIIELEDGKLFSYQANYSKYLEMKTEREENQQTANIKMKNLIKKELEWIRKGAQARSTKQKARIDRYQQMSDDYRPGDKETIAIQAQTSRLGRKTIEIENISKKFGELQVIKDFSHIFHRDERIGIIGPNGSGKSTLVKIIAGVLSPDSGTIVAGPTVKISYFSQEGEEMNGDTRVIDYIREASEYITTNDGSISASQMLERFLFPPDTQWAQISKLSGGEKRRLYLLRVLTEAPNILLLDEPTNDFDIQTLAILEDYLEEFKGAVVVVSHDRFFLDRVAKRLFVFEGNGKIKEYTGNYSDYAGKRQQLKIVEDASLKTQASKNLKSAGKAQVPKNQKSAGGKNSCADHSKTNGRLAEKSLAVFGPRKLTLKEQKELETIDEKMALIETELLAIKTKIEESASDYALLQEHFAKQKTREEELNHTMERWVYLTELSENWLNK